MSEFRSMCPQRLARRRWLRTAMQVATLEESHPPVSRTEVLYLLDTDLKGLGHPGRLPLEVGHGESENSCQVQKPEAN
jgi:hypothetical protein